MMPPRVTPSTNASGILLDDLQAQVNAWIIAHGGYWDRFQIMARLTEELGEISADLQRIEGLRGRIVEVDLEGEVGDLLFTLGAFANVSGIRLEAAFVRVMSKYERRDGGA